MLEVYEINRELIRNLSKQLSEAQSEASLAKTETVKNSKYKTQVERVIVKNRDLLSKIKKLETENLENIDTVISQKEYISQLLEENSEVKRREAVNSGDAVACSSCVSCGKFTRSVSTQKSDEEN